MKTWMLVVGIAILILLSSAFIAFADNPFIGRWTADGITVFASDSTAIVTVDSDDPDQIALRGIFAYTYDPDIFRAGNIVATYRVSRGGSVVALLCFLNGHPVCIIFQRIPVQDEGGGGT